MPYKPKPKKKPSKKIKKGKKVVKGIIVPKRKAKKQVDRFNISEGFKLLSTSQT